MIKDGDVLTSGSSTLEEIPSSKIAHASKKSKCILNSKVAKMMLRS